MSVSPRAGFLLAALGLPLACGGSDTLFDHDGATGSNDFPSADGTETTATLKQASISANFLGAGTSGAAAPLSVGLGPDTSNACDPTPAAGASAATPVQHVCFFSKDDPTELAASIEQVVEVVGTKEWVHLRLTLSPNFVDNTYGQNAIGWGDTDTGAGASGPGAERPSKPAGDTPPGMNPPPPAPGEPAGPRGNAAPPPQAGDAPPPAPGNAPPPGDAPAPPAQPGAGGPPGPGAGPGAADAGPGAAGPQPHAGGHGHTFRDLVESDHAEIQLLDASGQVAMEFRLDYLSASDAAPSGYAALGVSGGEGRLSVGDPSWILASTSSMSRNLNACGLGSFLTDSPETDESYTPNPAAGDWDYRVAYEVWVSTAAFGDAGFGSALIQLVHASPSKQGGASLNVAPAPCPTDPDDVNATPEPLPPVLATIR